MLIKDNNSQKLSDGNHIKPKFKLMTFDIVVLLIFVLSIVVDIILKVNNVYKRDSDLLNSFGVSTQIITAIATAIISIVGLSTSLQNEECFGISFKNLYNLRTDNYYSFLRVTVTSIMICTINIVSFMFGFLVICGTSALISVAFCIYVSAKEIPLLIKEDYAVIKVLDKKLESDIKNEEESSKELKEAIKYLLVHRTFNITFKFFQKNEIEYDKELYKKLLEYQANLACDLRKIADEEKKENISDSLITNIKEIFLTKEDDIYFDVIYSNIYSIAVTIFRLKQLPCSNKMITNLLSELIHRLYGLKSNKEAHIIMSVIIKLLIYSVPYSDLTILDDLRKAYSTYLINRDEDRFPYILLSLISFYLYYLCCEEEVFPHNVKDKIISFINDSKIEDNTKYISWNELFNKFSKYFPVSLDCFLFWFSIFEHEMDYFLFGSGAKVIVLNNDLAVTWFISNYLNRYYAYQNEYSTLTYNEKNKEILKRVCERCFNGKEFQETPQMKRIALFFDNKDKPFGYFKQEEGIDHKLFEYINNLKLSDLEKKSKEASEIEYQKLESTLNNHLNKELSSEWNFDDSIDLEDISEKRIEMFLELSPEAINFNEFFLEAFTDFVFREIEKSIEYKRILGGNDFENRIEDLLSKNITHISDSAKDTIPYYINDEDLKSAYIQKTSKTTIIKSKLIYHEIIVIDSGFKFRCEITKLNIRGLSNSELNNYVRKYQREDGQFVFNGVFLSQDKIKEIILKKFAVVSIGFKYKVLSSPETLYEIIPYEDEQNNSDE